LKPIRPVWCEILFCHLTRLPSKVRVGTM
jgi:hypothetical protein